MVKHLQPDSQMRDLETKKSKFDSDCSFLYLKVQSFATVFKPSLNGSEIWIHALWMIESVLICLRFCS